MLKFWRRTLSVILGILIIAGSVGYLGYQKILRENYAVPILMYHSVDVKFTKLNRSLVVSPGVFERQMRFLRNHRYNVISLESLAGLIREGRVIPPKTVVITFDDGYQDNYTYAFAILKKYRIPATIFIIVNEVGRAQADRLSWEELLEMQDSGLVTLGSHSLAPEPLVNIESEAQLRQQIFLSKERLEKRLKQPVNTFSYTSGMFTPEIRALVIAAGYKAAVATRPGLEYPNDDIFALKRIRISASSGNLIHFWLNCSGTYTYLKEWQRSRRGR